MRFFGDEGGHSWEEYGPEIYAGKRKEKWGVYILTEEIGRECLYALGEVAAVNRLQNRRKRLFWLISGF